MSRTLYSALLMVFLLGPAAPALAHDADRAVGRPEPAVKTLRASIDAAAGRLAASSPEGSSAVMRPAPRGVSDRSFKQRSGGGSAGVVIGVVSAAVGVATTVYLVKRMKESTREPDHMSRLAR